MSSEALQQAYRLIREGNKQDAARLLVPIVRAEPLNADAWWLLANAVENTQQQARALKHVLSLRPNDERAKEMLARLQANAALSARAGGPADNFPLGDVSERKSRPVSLILVLIGVITIIACAGLIAVAVLSQAAIQGVYGRVLLTVTAVAINQPFSNVPTQIVPTAVPTLPPDLVKRGSISDGQTVSNTVATFTDDGWTFTAKANEHVTIELDAVDAKLDPQLYLYAPNGILFAANDDIDGANNRNSRLDLTLTTGGTYTIRVGKFADGGQYRLSLKPQASWSQPMMRRLFLLTFLLLSMAASAQAQDDSHVIPPGGSVEGVIDADHLMQMYRFEDDPSGDGGFGFVNTGAIPLRVVMIDPQGRQIDQTGVIAPGANEASGWSDLGPGALYLIIVPAQGVSGGQGSFRLGVNALAPSSSSPNFDLQFVLTWHKQARLSLEVRDPEGESLHWRNPNTDDSGEFVGDTQPALCSTPTLTDREQTARWQGEESGSYEILVHYIDGCDPSVPFTVAVRLNGQDYPLISGTAQPNSTYVSGFTVNPDRSGAINAHSGLVSDQTALTINTDELKASAQPLPAGGALADYIDSNQPFRSYSFNGRSGEQISATVMRASDSLDTLLALIDAQGKLIAINDDASSDTTNSALTNVRLPSSGRYYLIVTRYAEALGSTEGEFVLAVTTTND